MDEPAGTLLGVCVSPRPHDASCPAESSGPAEAKRSKTGIPTLARLAERALQQSVRDESKAIRTAAEHDILHLMTQNESTTWAEWERRSLELEQGEEYRRVLHARRELARAERAYCELRDKHAFEFKERARVRRRATAGEVERRWQDCYVCQQELAQRQQAQVEQHSAALFPACKVARSVCEKCANIFDLSETHAQIHKCAVKDCSTLTCGCGVEQCRRCHRRLCYKHARAHAQQCDAHLRYAHESPARVLDVLIT